MPVPVDDSAVLGPPCSPISEACWSYHGDSAPWTSMLVCRHRLWQYDAVCALVADLEKRRCLTMTSLLLEN
jgi:hypothetical protein